MKKVCAHFAVMCALVVFAVSTVRAEGWATGAGSCYAKGDKILDIGIPFPFFQLGVHGAFDYGVHDAISVGGGMGFHYNYAYLGFTGGNTYVTFLARAAFHPFNLSALQDKIKIRDKLDVYGGLTLFAGPSLNGGDFLFPLREYFGARWHFSPKISAFLEDCAGFGYLDGGISFNL